MAVALTPVGNPNPSAGSLPPAPPQRYAYLDGLRAVLALYVVAQHAWYTVSDYDGRSLSPLLSVLTQGHYAVCFFILLSGFCLMLPVLKHDFSLAGGAGLFFQRRAWRILPSYYLALILSVLLATLLIHASTGTIWDLSIPLTLRSVLDHLVLMQNFVPADVYKINYVHWSIAIEWQIYFLFPLLLLGWRRLGPKTTTVLVVLAAWVVEHSFIHHSALAPNTNFLGLFALGMFAAYICFSTQPLADRWRSLPWRWLAVGSAAVLIYLDRTRHQLTADVCFGGCAAAVLVIAAQNPSGWLRRFLGFKPLVWIGTFSYSLYLIHAPLLQLLWQYPLAPLQSQANVMCLTLIAVGGPLIVLAAYIFHLGCERPFLRLLGRMPR
jgi:peptidoglycan/LPS O-acetylase OafA/YrhL